MGKNKLEIHAQNPSLNNKLHIDQNTNADQIFWYITFSIPLDPSSITPETMAVMDEEDHILQTAITCNPKSRHIIIQPLVPYRQGQTYCLNISKKVCSASGAQLKEDVCVLFKLQGTEIYDMNVLKGQEIAEYRINRKTRPVHRAPLPLAPITINPWPALGSLLFILAAFILNFSIVSWAALLFLLVGILHIAAQLVGNKMRSVRLYNKGAKIYNQNPKNASQALVFIQGALKKNAGNEMAADAIAQLKR